MARITFNFDTTPYSNSHGREPRGYGSWAFSCRAAEPAMPHLVWAPAATYADAKKWMASEVRAIAPAGFDGIITIRVLP